MSPRCLLSPVYLAWIKVLFSVMSDCLFTWGNRYVTTTHDANGQSQITWQWRIQGGRAPTDQNFLNFMQFFGKSGKLVCWRPQGLAPPPTGNLVSAPTWATSLNLFTWTHPLPEPVQTFVFTSEPVLSVEPQILLFWTPGQASSPCLSDSLPVINRFLTFTSFTKPLGS